MSNRQQALEQKARQLLELAQSWYAGREAREQRALQALSLALVIFVFYFAVLLPVFQYRHDARLRFESNAELYQWIEANRPALGSVQRNSAAAPATGDWVARVNAAASKAGVALKGASPEGEDAVRVQLEDQPFAAVIGWLDAIGRDYGGQIKNINIAPGNASGTVNVRATLQGAL